MKLSSPPPFLPECMDVCMLSWMCGSWNKWYYQRVRCSGQGVGLTIASAWRFWWRIGSGRPLKFFLRKKSKKEERKPRHFSPFPFPSKELPNCRQLVASLAFETERRKRIIFADSNQAIRPQHTINPANFMRQLAIAQWLVRPTVNLLNVTHHSICSFSCFFNVFF